METKLEMDSQSPLSLDEVTCGQVLGKLLELGSPLTNDNYDWRRQEELILELLKVLRTATIPVPNFTISFTEPRPLFDGSFETENYFVLRHYINYSLYREEAHPISQIIANDEKVDSKIEKVDAESI